MAVLGRVQSEIFMRAHKPLIAECGSCQLCLTHFTSPWACFARGLDGRCEGTYTPRLQMRLRRLVKKRWLDSKVIAR